MIIPHAVCHLNPTSNGKQECRQGGWHGPRCHLFLHHQHPDWEGRCPVAQCPQRLCHGCSHKSSKPWGDLSASQVCPSIPWHPGQPHDPVVARPNPVPCYGLIALLSGRADGRNLTLSQLPQSPTLPFRSGEPSLLSRSWCSLSCPYEELG